MRQVSNISYDDLEEISGLNEVRIKLTKFLKEHEKGRIKFGKTVFVRGGRPKDLELRRWLQEKAIFDAEIAGGIRNH